MEAKIKRKMTKKEIKTAERAEYETEAFAKRFNINLEALVEEYEECETWESFFPYLTELWRIRDLNEIRPIEFYYHAIRDAYVHGLLSHYYTGVGNAYYRKAYKVAIHNIMSIPNYNLLFGEKECDQVLYDAMKYTTNSDRL